jgi:hypothetical protein
MPGESSFQRTEVQHFYEIVFIMSLNEAVKLLQIEY